jgi:hypothetical protein
MNFECFFCMYFLYINIKIRRFSKKKYNGFVFTTSEDKLAIAFTYNTIKNYLKDKKGKKILS